MNTHLNVVSNLNQKELKININQVGLWFLREVIVTVSLRESTCTEWTVDVSSIRSEFGE